MAIDIAGRRIDYPQLMAELAAASVTHSGLVTTGTYASGPDAGKNFLKTRDAAGELIDLPAGAAAVVTAHVPPPIPDVPVYGPDLYTPEDLAAQAATAVSNLRAYIALPSPNLAQSTAVLKLLCRIAIYFVRRQLT